MVMEYHRDCDVHGDVHGHGDGLWCSCRDDDGGAMSWALVIAESWPMRGVMMLVGQFFGGLRP